MKSIKENSNDYVSGFHPSIQKMCKESYIDGANYVLDLLIAEDDKYDTVMECYYALASLIRELKSNQK